MEHPVGGLDWNSIRVLVAVADSGSFRRTAELLNISVNTVRRLIERFEYQLGYKLFHRKVDGVTLTAEARRMINAVREVDKAVAQMWRIAEGASVAAGPIRVAVTEGLGTFWLTPRLVDFIDNRSTPDRVELQGAISNIDVLRLEADISVQLVEPTNPDLIVKKLGYLHLVPFASPEYLQTFGNLDSLMDLPRHRIVEQASEQLSGLGVGLAKLFSAEIADSMIRLKTNLSSANYWAVVKGAGLGLLPNYAAMIGGRIEYVDIGFKFTTPIWMAMHPEVAKTTRHRDFIDLLTQSFDAHRYPWFGERFMTPAEIAATNTSDDLSEYFRGFVASR